MAEEGTVARAFAIARQGTCRTIDDVRRQLNREGYTQVAEHLGGGVIRKQLKELLKV